jgi:hypothetical protein
MDERRAGKALLLNPDVDLAVVGDVQPFDDRGRVGLSHELRRLAVGRVARLAGGGREQAQQ